MLGVATDKTDKTIIKNVRTPIQTPYKTCKTFLVLLRWSAFTFRLLGHKPVNYYPPMAL